MPPVFSLTGKRWVCNSLTNWGRDSVRMLAAQRGIDPAAVATIGALSDPMTLGEMEKAVSRFQKTVTRKETVGIIGDYDADGITGAAQLVRLMKRHNVPCHVILPHRQKHGYGVKEEFIDEMKENGVTLLLTVDTGIGATKEIMRAGRLGMDVIVLDHHDPPAKLPNAIVLHPQIRSRRGVECRAPAEDVKKATNSQLSGSGIAFTFVRAVEGDDWHDRNVDLALAAIGTVADVVPLLGDNRTIVQLGLQALNNGHGHPVFELAAEVRGKSERLTSGHIGFRIAPRINASGRIDDPHLALQALLDGGEAIQKLHELNGERQSMMLDMVEYAETLVDPFAPIISLHSGYFHPGIIGLIAGKLTEKYGRPSCIGSLSQGRITCSLRSIPKYHITDALSRCSAFLTGFGGHSAAAGCTLLEEEWETFVQAFQKDAASTPEPVDLVPTLHIDGEIAGVALTLDLVKEFQELEPFGAGNPEPRFLLRNCTAQWVRRVGSKKQHLQCRLNEVKAVGFGLGYLQKQLQSNLSVVCRLGIDTWNGRGQVQLYIEDVATFEG